MTQYANAQIAERARLAWERRQRLARIRWYMARCGRGLPNINVTRGASYTDFPRNTRGITPQLVTTCGAIIPQEVQDEPVSA